MRLDRIDRLNDDSLLVIDYKSGVVSPSSWDLPRPDDVQLPLYAGFALEDGPESAGGLVFAQIRAGERKEFLGRVKDARATLMSDLSANKALVKKPLTDEEMRAWRDYIEEDGARFHCGPRRSRSARLPEDLRTLRLQALCRIQENPPQAEDENDDAEEAVDA